MRPIGFALFLSCAASLALGLIFGVQPVASAIIGIIMFGLCAIALRLYHRRRE